MTVAESNHLDESEFKCKCWGTVYPGRRLLRVELDRLSPVTHCKWLRFCGVNSSLTSARACKYVFSWALGVVRCRGYVPVEGG